jgi:hypothetical protein
VCEAIVYVSLSSIQNSSTSYRIDTANDSPRGSHPPRQKVSIPQNPNSEQHGAEAGHRLVALQVCAEVCVMARVRPRIRPYRVKEGMLSCQSSISVVELVICRTGSEERCC